MHKLFHLLLVAGTGVFGCAVGSGLAAASAAAPDARNFANGQRIPVEGYCDQPRIVVTKDGAWVCVLTTGPGVEGAEGQHVVATVSEDKGKKWSSLTDIEPADKERKSAYALALITPQDRIYAFYNYNGDAIHTKPDGKPIRDDMQGWFCYRYSDDKGKSWSKRYRLPMRVTAADRTNDWQGKVQMFWAIGTPAVWDGKAMFGFSKLGKYILENGEGWFYRSDNILREPDPDKLDWQLLPDGDNGVRLPEFGSVQEEFDVAHLEKEELMCVYRTTLGPRRVRLQPRRRPHLEQAGRAALQPRRAHRQAAARLHQNLADAQWPLPALVPQQRHHHLQWRTECRQPQHRLAQRGPAQRRLRLVVAAGDRGVCGRRAGGMQLPGLCRGRRPLLHLCHAKNRGARHGRRARPSRRSVEPGRRPRRRHQRPRAQPRRPPMRLARYRPRPEARPPQRGPPAPQVA